MAVASLPDSPHSLVDLTAATNGGVSSFYFRDFYLLFPLLIFDSWVPNITVTCFTLFCRYVLATAMHIMDIPGQKVLLLVLYIYAWDENTSENYH